MIDFCKANKIQQSMTDAYASWRNGIIETFFNIIKQNYFKVYKFLNKTEFLYWIENCFWNYSKNRIINKLKITPIEMYKSNLVLGDSLAINFIFLSIIFGIKNNLSFEYIRFKVSLICSL